MLLEKMTETNMPTAFPPTLQVVKISDEVHDQKSYSKLEAGKSEIPHMIKVLKLN